MRIQAKVFISNYEIRERREKLKLSQKEFASIVGINLTDYCEIERIQRKPTREEATSIALELDCDKDILFPEGYDELTMIFHNPIVSIGEYTPNQIAAGSSFLELTSPLDAKMTTEKLFEITGLSPKEKKILEMRHGIKSLEGARTLDETAKEFGVTRERIRQIETLAYEKIKEAKYKYDKKHKAMRIHKMP